MEVSKRQSKSESILLNAAAILDPIGSKQRLKALYLSPGREQPITRISSLGGATTTPGNQVPFDFGADLFYPSTFAAAIFLLRVSQAFS